MGKFTFIFIAGAIMAVGWTLSKLQQSQPPIEKETALVVSTDRIVSHLMPVQELASLKVGASGIVRARQPGQYFWQGESTLVMLVRGQAIYSIDLSTIELNASGETVIITLDPPRISDYWVDVEETEIWERHVGRFRSADNSDIDVACWASARSLVFQAANAEHHQKIARNHAEHTIRSVLLDAVECSSVRTVHVQWRKSG